MSTGSKQYLIHFIEKLFEKSIRQNNGEFKWISIIDYRSNKKVYNISMSHGIASIISVLSKIYIKNIEPKKVKLMIEGAIVYLLNQKLPPNQFNSIYPNQALESMDRLYSSRLAWCYGDLGIAMAIWHASQALNNKCWEEEAINTFLHSGNRRNLKLNGVADAGLCHGAAGVAHIFNRIYGYTGILELKKASDYWVDETLKMARHKDGLAGFKTWQNDSRVWINEPGLLEGIAGIGLAMISAVSDIEPAWDECLLLS